MKKFAAIILSALMVLSMVAIGVSSVSAAVKGNDGALNVYKKSDTEPASASVTVDENDPSTKKSLSGATFTIYKVFEHTDGGYVLQDDFKTALSGYVETLTKAKNTDNTYVTYGSTNALADQVGKAQVAAAATTAPSENVKVTNGSGLAEFTGLDYGVYLVVETNPPTGYTAKSQPFFVNIESGTAVNTYPKNEPFNMTKEIGNATSSSSAASYSIGDTVPYIVRTKTPAYNTLTLDALYADKHGKDVEGGTTAPDLEQPDVKPDTIDDYNGYIPFYFTDKLSKGLTLVKGAGTTDADKLKAAFTVTIGGAAYTDFTVTEGTPAANGDVTYTINFPFDTIYASNGVNKLNQDVVITYSAVLNEYAKINGDATGTNNNNDIDLHFKNDPSTTSGPIDYNTTTGDPEVYTYEMDLTKLLNGGAFSYDSTRTSDRKPVFKLYSAADKSTGIQVKSTTTAGVYTVDKDDAETANISELTVADNGTLQLRGLAAGDYFLEEVTAPHIDGKDYTPLTSAIQITVTDGKDSDNKLDGTVVATINNGADENLVTNTNGKFAFNVNNPATQFELPTTGGYGILIFTLGGAVVLAAAIIIFTVARKKKDTK